MSPLLTSRTTTHDGITVIITHDFNTRDVVLMFRIPETFQVLTKDPMDFMHWVYDELMEIGKQSRDLVKK